MLSNHRTDPAREEDVLQLINAVHPESIETSLYVTMSERELVKDATQKILDYKKKMNELWTYLGGKNAEIIMLNAEIAQLNQQMASAPLYFGLE